jgi:hypothetical protein
LQDAPYYISKEADPTTHRVFVAGGSDPKGCANSAAHASLFKVESVEAYTRRPSIEGRVVDIAARPVPGRKVEVYALANPTDAPCLADPRPSPDSFATH